MSTVRFSAESRGISEVGKRGEKSDVGITPNDTKSEPGGDGKNRYSFISSLYSPEQNNFANNKDTNIEGNTFTSIKIDNLTINNSAPDRQTVSPGQSIWDGLREKFRRNVYHAEQARRNADIMRVLSHYFENSARNANG